MKYLRFFVLFLFCLGAYSTASGQVVITEIMYDVEGADSGREWIEVSNISNESVDLTSWKFFEDGSNHGLKIYQGDAVLSSGGTAIIADDPTKFLIDWSGFSGTIFDSSFSLKNSGEEIALRNADLVDIDSVYYNSDQGAGGDGNSLQKINGAWSAGVPTPGKAERVGGAVTQASNTSSQPNNNQTEPQSNSVVSEQQTTSSSGATSVLWPDDTKVFTRIKPMRKVVVVGADIRFSGDAVGQKKETLDNVQYLWAFGDGATAEGKEVLHHYNYPGKYVVILDTAYGKYRASDRIYIEVIPADVIIASVGTGDQRDSFIDVQNNTRYELDLSEWKIRSGLSIFTIPKNTIIIQNSSIIFSGENTGFTTKNLEIVDLLYPNGRKAFSYSWEESTPDAKVANVISDVVLKKENTNPVKNTKDAVAGKDEVIKVAQEPPTSFVFAGERQVATVNNLTTEQGNNTYRWIYSLVGIILVSVLSFFTIKRDNNTVLALREGDVKDAAPVENIVSATADEYEIEVVE